MTGGATRRRPRPNRDEAVSDARGLVFIPVDGSECFPYCSPLCWMHRKNFYLRGTR
ncbi:hypothetical protein BVI434_2080016 [Burkholderia vietnamiensis]|nr:hypothetical protein BVI434_2080016 [Burkholderia vietnamiensis]